MTPATKVYSYLRFSTPEQLKGDSQRRQLERSQEWAKNQGLTLDESLTMKDLGLSAYSGAHRAKGALGSFLKAVEGGTIQPGSILIVESLDRLSRQDVVDAQTQFMSLINAGIEVVTLADGYRYSRESIKDNWTQLIVSLAIMARANEESKMKADRLGEVWKEKRNNLSERKLTTNSPAWLKLNRKTQTFEAIPEYAEIVKLIYRFHLDGHGAYKITKILNDRGIKPFGKTKSWYKSGVRNILKNKAVTGEFQPHRLIAKDGRKTRIPVGDPISNYYPRIISDEAFYSVQHSKEITKTKGGRKGFVSNLFTHIGHCGYCGTKAHLIHKGKWKYIRCYHSKYGNECKSGTWNIEELENAFLNECRELDVASILPNGNGRAAKIKAAQQALDGIQGELTDLEKRIGNMEKTIELAEFEAVISMFIPKLDKALAEKKDAELALHDAALALSAAQSETTTTEQQLKSLHDLIRKLENTEGDDLIQLRERLKNAIAQLVERIELFPDGLGDRILTGDFTGHKLVSAADLIEHWENVGDDPDIFKPGDHDTLIGDLVAYQAQNTGKAARAFLVHFRSGGFRLVRRQGDGYVNEVSTFEALQNLPS